MKTEFASIFSDNELLCYIEFLRNRLIHIGLAHGFNSHRTIQASQELDFFIVEYQKMIRH